jgi:hypothetical protein
MLVKKCFENIEANMNTEKITGQKVEFSCDLYDNNVSI